MSERFIICETQDRLLPLLRNLLTGTDIPIAQRRQPQEVLEVLEESKRSMVLLELAPPRSEAVLEVLDAIHTRYPHARVMVAAHGLAEYECLARELGAVFVSRTPADLPAAATVVMRHFSRLPEPAALTIEEQIWSRLPWQD